MNPSNIFAEKDEGARYGNAVLRFADRLAGILAPRNNASAAVCRLIHVTHDPTYCPRGKSQLIGTWHCYSGPRQYLKTNAHPCR